MMGLLSNLFSNGVSEIVDSVGNALDKITTSDEEREIAKQVMEKIKNEARSKSDELSMEFEREITKRWTSDNEHIITRLIRPISYASILTLFGAIILSDGNIGEFKINSAYIPVIETLLTTMTIAYFGSRGVEKVSKEFKK